MQPGGKSIRFEMQSMRGSLVQATMGMMRKVWASNLESLRSGSADPDSKPWLPASQSLRKRLTGLSAMQLDVSFQAQHNTLHENNGPDNYANSRNRSDFPERVFLGAGRVVDSSRTSRIVAYVPVLNVIGQQCPKSRIYGGEMVVMPSLETREQQYTGHVPSWGRR
jgi:hypothetical protein